MRRVVQKDDYGCGIACVAMLSGISYNEARDLLEDLFPGNYEKSSKSYLTTSTKLKKMLIKLKVLKKNKKFKSPRSTKAWDKVAHKSLVAINYKKNSSTWHWVVLDFDRKGRFVLDPSPDYTSKKRRDFDKMKLHNFLELEV